MKNWRVVLWVALTFAVVGTVQANDSLGRKAPRQSDGAARTLWEPHIVVFNDTKSIVVVYTGRTINKDGTFMTYYPGEQKKYYYGLLTFGYQKMAIRDSTGSVFFNSEVPDETLVHITSHERSKITEFHVSFEPLLS